VRGRVQASASAGKKKAAKSNILSGCTTKNPIEQEAPGAEAPHVHKRSEGRSTNNGVGKGAGDETRKLGFYGILAEDLTSKFSRVAGGSKKPVVKAATKRFKDTDEGRIRTGWRRRQSF
jgi:hypothetical protein